MHAPHSRQTLTRRPADALRDLGRHLSYATVSLLRDVRGLFSSRAMKASPPTDFNLEPSNLCNADCVFCAYQHQGREHTAIDMALAERIIDAARRSGARHLGLTPIVGEPLVHKQLEALIRQAKRPPGTLEVGLTTNGILLTPERYLSLVEAGIDSIGISMSYPDRAEYEALYRNGSFTRLEKNIRGILAVYEPGQCRMAIGVRTPRGRGWRHPLFAAAAARGWAVHKNVFFDDWSGTVTEGLRQHGLALRPNRAKRLPCSMLFSGPHFLSDGRATACGCRDLDGRSELALDASALIADPKAVYGTGAVESLRARFRQGDLPGICADCRHYTPHYPGEPARLKALQVLGSLRILLGGRPAGPAQPRTIVVHKTH